METGPGESIGSCSASHTSLSPGSPGAAVQAWDTRRVYEYMWGGVGVMCVLVIFSHLPLFSPTDPN
jgi:hypothetical protein